MIGKDIGKGREGYKEKIGHCGITSTKHNIILLRMTTAQHLAVNIEEVIDNRVTFI